MFKNGSTGYLEKEEPSTKYVYINILIEISLQSHIDLWLISNDLADLAVDVLIEQAILTDHKGIFIKISLNDSHTQKYSTGYWKLNSSLLKNEDLKLEISGIIDKYWKQGCATNTYGYFWEIMKYEVRKVSIKKGKLLAKLKREKRIQNFEEISDLQMKNCENLTSQEVMNLNLNNIYEEETRAAFIRSRRKWLEQGEKNTKYFHWFRKKSSNYGCSNFDPIIEKTKLKLNLWLMRDVSLYGGVLLSKAEGISRSVYVSLSLSIPTNVIKKLDMILYDNIWRKKHHYLKKDVIRGNREEGGLEVLDFTVLNNLRLNGS